MSRDDGNDALRNEWYELGTIRGLQEAAAIIRLKAAEEFALDHDTEAKLLRELAKGLELSATNRRALHDQRYPK